MNIEDSGYIVALLERISRLINASGHAEGLKPVQWEVLRYLAKANRFSNTAAALTAYLGQTKGTVSQSLMTLTNKGFICKEDDSRDKRTTRLSLTHKGQQLLQNDPLLEAETALGSLSNTSRRQLGKSLTTYLSNLLAERERQPFGQCHLCRYFARNHPKGGPHRCQLVEEKLSETEADKICFEQNPKSSVLNK